MKLPRLWKSSFHWKLIITYQMWVSNNTIVEVAKSTGKKMCVYTHTHTGNLHTESCTASNSLFSDRLLEVRCLWFSRLWCVDNKGKHSHTHGVHERKDSWRRERQKERERWECQSRLFVFWAEHLQRHHLLSLHLFFCPHQWVLNSFLEDFHLKKLLFPHGAKWFFVGS